MRFNRRYIQFVLFLIGVSFLLVFTGSLSVQFFGPDLGFIIGYIILPAMMAWIVYARGYFSDTGFPHLEEKLFKPYFHLPLKIRLRIIVSVAFLGSIPVLVTLLLLPDGVEFPWFHHYPLFSIGIIYLFVCICYTGMLFERSRRFYNAYIAPLAVFIFGPLIGISSLIDFQYSFSFTDTAIVLTSVGLVILGSIGLLKGAKVIADKKARSDAELAFAGEVQKKFLGSKSTKTEGFTVFGTSETARNLGGDFFHLKSQDESRLLAAVGDVSGHSYGAGLIMVMLKTAFEDHLAYTSEPETLLAVLNRKLITQAERSMFCTLGCIELDTRKNQTTLMNAGHLPVLHYQSGSSELVQRHIKGPALGIMPEPSYEPMTFSVSSGDLLILYSDGLVETRDRQMNVREPNYFMEIVRNCIDKTDDRKTISRQILDEVKRSDHSDWIEDDLTLTVVRVD
ncbi:MAG: PP2C family protein-serine/threonine phosphatase [Balneolaceae bacterium]|nr:PP2C family protein-serine/threonine phosphatase [Balneolaceae bacterium]